jgi:hypothetical protein
MRILLKDEAAKLFYKAATADYKFTDFGESFEYIGGYWLEPNGVYCAYDFTNGFEVYIEDFDDRSEAIKYASGIMARTICGTKI